MTLVDVLVVDHLRPGTSRAGASRPPTRSRRRTCSSPQRSRARTPPRRAAPASAGQTIPKAKPERVPPQGEAGRGRRRGEDHVRLRVQALNERPGEGRRDGARPRPPSRGRGNRALEGEFAEVASYNRCARRECVCANHLEGHGRSLFGSMPC